jgi:hypothetical protein
MKRSHVSFAAAGVLVIVAAAAVLAADGRTSYPDGNDTRGVLDVEVVHYDKVPAEPQSWTVVTIARWGIGQLWDSGYITVWFDTEGAEAPDHYALVRSTGRRLEGVLMRISRQAGGRDRVVATLKVWRKTNDGVSVRIPLAFLDVGPFRESYRWWVVTSLTTGKCPATCLDRVPNRGAVEQWLPGMSPTPTPTNAPSP